MDEELELVKRYLAGDNLAGAALLRLHEPLLLKYAKRYRRRGVELEDLLQEAKIGFLIEGVPKFDPALGRLSTYATHWARKAMAEYMAKAELTVRVPGCARRKEATEAQKAGAQLARRTVSFDMAPEHTEAASDSSPEESLHAARMKVASATVIDRAVAALPPHERYVLRERLAGDAAGQVPTLASLGEAMGVSRERARQLEAQGRARILVRLCAMGVSEADEVEKAVR